MKRLPLLLISLLVIMTGAGNARADVSVGEDTDISQASRPVTGIYSLEFGSKKVLATYLSPLRYTGTDIAASGQWSKAMPFNPEHAVMQFDGSASFSDMLNPAETARMVGLNASFSWGMAWRTGLPYGLQLTAGGSIGADGGAYYLMRNGNNPVQAMASVSIAATASLSKVYQIGRLPILLRDEVSIPSASLFFSPEYGETYYEIYLGNHSGLVHAGWWGNNFRLDNHLSVALDFGRTAMTIGYRFKAETQWACNLNTRIFTHALVIGVVPGGLGLKKRKAPRSCISIHSLY